MKTRDNVLIRELTYYWDNESEIEAVADLASSIAVFKANGITKRNLEYILASDLEANNGDTIFLAEDEGTVIGFAWLKPKGAFANFPYLNGLAVHPDYQQMNIGTMLLEEVENLTIVPFGLFVLIDKQNTNAIQFFTQHGYVPIGEISNLMRKGHGALIYRKVSCTDEC